MANDRQQWIIELRRILETFVATRQRLIRFLEESATDLDGLHRRVSRIRIGTGITGLTGTIIGAVGFLSGMLTGGLSIPLIAGGGTLALWSGGARLGSSIGEHISHRSYINRLRELSENDEANYTALINYLRINAEELPNNAMNANIPIEMRRDVVRVLNLINTNVGYSVIRVVQIGTTSFQVLSVGAIAASGIVAVPLQVIELVQDIRAMRTNEATRTANQFRELARDLTAQTQNLTQQIHEIINQYAQDVHRNNRQIIPFNAEIVILLLPFILIIFIIIQKLLQYGFSFF